MIVGAYESRTMFEPGTVLPGCKVKSVVYGPNHDKTALEFKITIKVPNQKPEKSNISYTVPDTTHKNFKWKASAILRGILSKEDPPVNWTEDDDEVMALFADKTMALLVVHKEGKTQSGNPTTYENFLFFRNVEELEEFQARQTKRDDSGPAKVLETEVPF